MPTGIPGVDSLVEANASLLEIATSFLGASPQYWGRYFYSPTSSAYNSSAESIFLNAHHIKVLPIARQTPNVAGDEVSGANDAKLNANAILDAFPRLAGSYFVFLDVEGLPEDGQPSLSAHYYTGWSNVLTSQGLSASSNAVTFLPCVYARVADDTTWQALIDAIAFGANCRGAWAAHVPHTNACQLGPIMWNSTLAEPSIGLPFEILAWQYAQDCANQALDYNQTNIHITPSTDFLPYLIEPAIT
jgi:hypothetical protein